MIGRKIGDYRIVSELGKGAMGVVYYGEHERIGRRVAIKILRERLARSKEMVERLFREARAVNDIRHPNIVTVTDFLEVDGRACIVMELLEGETLEARIERDGPMQEAQAAGIVEQIARALEAAHGRGVVHRDLKPENVYITNHRDYPDYVKVLDFGIAKLLHPVEVSGTQDGMVMGTPQYMSPEQCLGAKEVDARSDIYSLGVVLYEMLVAEPPFTADTAGKLILAHVQDEPRPLREHRPELSELLDQVVLRCLEKRPEDRFQTMESLRRAMRPSLPPRPLPKPITRRGKGRSSSKKQAPAGKSIPSTVNVPGESGQARPRIGKETLAEQQALLEIARPSGLPRPASEQKRIDERPLMRRLERIVMGRIHRGRLSLPAMPEAAAKVIEALEREDPSFSELSRIVERDPLIASQIVRVANSPFYAPVSPIRTVEEAVTRIGLDGLRSLLFQISVHSLYRSRDPRIRKAFEEILEHSLAVGHLCREIARLLPRGPDPEEAYLAGLLHDVGKPVVGVLLLEAEKQLGESGWMDRESWLRVVEGCHRDVGVALAMAWKLPAAIARIVKSCKVLAPTAGASTSNVVCFGNALAKLEGFGGDDEDRPRAEALVATAGKILRLQHEDVAALRAGLRARAAGAVRGASPDVEAAPRAADGGA